tara:strand:- start:377 stop:844 length:468 start_codon:yes stop_codon:yes gene_type:complete
VYIEDLNGKVPSTIHSVPALYFVDTKEVIFGKDVFDYLFLPGRGKLVVSSSSTRTDNNASSSKDTSGPMNLGDTPLVPQAISTSSMELMFEELEYEKTDKDNEIHNTMEQWENLDSKDNTMNSTTMMNLDVKQDFKDSKKLPTLEEIMKERENIS